MTHRKPVAYRSPVFRICGATPLPASHCFPSPRFRCGRRDPPMLERHQPSRQIYDHRRCPARSPAAARPARSPHAPRASLGASARSPPRPSRPRGSLQSGGSWRAFPLPSQALAPHAAQNSPSRHTTPVSRPFFTSGRSEGVECATEQKGITCTRRPHLMEQSIQSSGRNRRCTFSIMCILNNHDRLCVMHTPTTGEHHEE